MPLRFQLRHLLALLPFALTACSAPQFPIERAAGPYPLTSAPKVGEIFHPATGTLVAEQEMLSIVTDNRIVYVGETHDNPASHRFQLTVLRAMQQRYPGNITLGMEMFTPEQQEALDRWSSGELDEKSFLREVKWFSGWKGDFDLYRDLLVFARDNRIPVIGLNIDKKTKRAVLMQAPEEMTAEERQGIPELDLSDPYHTAMVEAIYSDHSKSEGMLAGFQRVQALWDEAMAASIVTYLRSPQGEDRRMVVLAGGNHVRHGFGIPRRVFRQHPSSYSLVGSKEVEIPESRRDQLMNVEMPDFPMPAYDFIAFTRYEEVENKKVKLGVMFEEVEEGAGLRIKQVVPESAADLAGLQKDDVLRQLDGEELVDSFDLIYNLHQKKEGDRINLGYERSGKSFSTEAVLTPLKPHANP